MDPEFKRLLSTLFRSHPWHSVSPGKEAPFIVRTYVEMVPPGTVKMELDKDTGHLLADRPIQYSSTTPTLYGFIPQSYCGERVAQLAGQRTGRKRIQGDGDPLDICVLTEKDFCHGDLFVTVRPIGGLTMIDKGKADDKIIAVLDQDLFFGHVRDISDVQPSIIERLEHYFLSYKRPPGEPASRSTVQIKGVYDKEEAHRVIRASLADYEDTFGTEEERLNQLQQLLLRAVDKDRSPSRKPRRRRK